MVSLFDFACLWLAIGLPLAVGCFVGKMFGLWPGIILGILLAAPCVVAAIRLNQAPRMKLKWKWLVLFGIPVMIFTPLVWALFTPQTPVDVIGKLSEKDVVEITAAVKREMRREIMPDFSWRSFKAAPGVIKRNSSIRLFTFSEWLPNFVNVYVWLNTNELPRFTESTNYFLLRRGTGAADKFLALARTNALNLKISRDSNGWAIYRGFYAIPAANP